jgi:MFS family permease
MDAPPAAVDEFRTPRPIAGWRVVAAAFWMAVFAWGLGFYALSLYVHHLSSAAGWPVALLSAATTGYFLLGAVAIRVAERAAARHGRRRIAIAGTLLLAAAVAALPRATHPVALLAAYAAMAMGWAATSGTAVSQVIGAWFERRRGLALNLALTGASASGFLVVPPMAWCIAALGPADGLALVAAVMAATTVAAIAFNLPAPQAGGAAGVEEAPRSGGAGREDGTQRADAEPRVAGTQPVDAAPRVVAAPAVAAPPDDRARLAHVTAIFAVALLAQVAFLAQQVPLLVPKVGLAQATAAVGLTTAASLVGRLLVSVVIDRIDHRAATAGSLALQALGMALLLASDAPALVLAGCVAFGLSVGNLITLPAIFAQREFAPERYGAVIERVWSTGQVLFAFGPIAAGAAIAATGGPAATLAACLACQLVAAALCLRPARGG